MMVWILVIIVLVLSAIIYRNQNESHNDFLGWRNQKREEFLKDVRENWNNLRIGTNNCNVINFNTKVNKNSPTYALNNKNITLFERLNRDPNVVNLVDVARSKIVCNYLQDGSIVRKFSTTVEMDNTVVEFKLRLRDYVDVYYLKGIQDENYFIDLEFLNEDIDLSKLN